MTDTDASLLARLQEMIRQLREDSQLAYKAAKAQRSGSCDRAALLATGDAETSIADRLENFEILAADTLRRSGEALRRLQEEIEQLTRYASNGQVIHYRGNYGEFVLRADVLEILSRPSGAEGTEAGGRSQPLAPIIEEWQPIATAPKDGTSIVIRFENDIHEPEVCKFLDGHWRTSDTCALWPPDYWMPLLPLPERKTDGQQDARSRDCRFEA